MKLIRFFLTALMISNLVPKAIGQNLLRNDRSILKDTLWIEQNIWKEANLCYKDRGFYLKEEEAMKIDFYCIPVTIYNEKVMNYEYNMNFLSIISLDSSRVAGLVLYNDQIVGFLLGYKRNGKWRAAPIEIFLVHNHLKIALDSLKSNMNNRIYFVSPLEKICYVTNQNNFIFDNIYQKFVKIEDFLQERTTLDAMRKYYKKYLEKEQK